MIRKFRLYLVAKLQKFADFLDDVIYEHARGDEYAGRVVQFVNYTIALIVLLLFMLLVLWLM